MLPTPKRLLALTATTMLWACAVGPDFTTPAAPDVKRYTDTDLPQATASAEAPVGAAQNFSASAGLPRDWWKLFGSDGLNALMDRALKANPDLKAASAAMRQARERYLASIGGLLPSADAGFNAAREKLNPASFGQTGAPASLFTLYNASVGVSYVLDVFGGTRREVEAAAAQAEAQQHELEAAWLSLTANVVTAAVRDASLREQVKETLAIAEIESKQLDVLKKQFDLGGTPKAIVLAQEAELAQTQTALPPLQKQLAQVRNQLAVLTGELPANTAPETFDLAGLKLPEQIPLSVPSTLVQRRPDIKAAEAAMHAASAGIGVATANMLPRITLNAGYSSQATAFGDLFTSGAEGWSVGAGLLQPLFRGGSLLHEKRAAVAAYERSAALYQSTVLSAFKDVADSLRALQYDAEGLKAQVNAAQAAKNSLDLAQTQFAVGAISYPQLLDAQRTYSQTRVGLVQAQAARFADTAALFAALGGGWEEPVTDKKPEKSEKKP